MRTPLHFRDSPGPSSITRVACLKFLETMCSANFEPATILEKCGGTTEGQALGGVKNAMDRIQHNTDKTIVVCAVPPTRDPRANRIR